MFKSVLIANRGEIAVRVAIACQELGIRALAVYSEADRAAAHVRAADAAICIGAAPARASYLNIDALIAAARTLGAEAIHPGYGFLSENAEFAEACAAAGVVFIGPPPEAIRLMGSKTAARAAVEAVGVPTVPGYTGSARDARSLQREAGRIGYPVLIKAAAGGGGKGMRTVASSGEFLAALEAAQREALAAFGDDSVFLEKLVQAPRHVEFQILADRYGAVMHLGERECSIQRRHQKVIEESPCAVLTPALREAMGTDAVRAARAAGYINAGTCEFLLDGDGRYYFLEMNTRLQVEHPVTEQVMGRDLVHAQLGIAAGKSLAELGLTPERIAPRGHAIEARIYAEDPANGYLPSTGRVLAFATPSAPGVRIDAGIAAGDEVSVYYDPMLAKLTVSADDRPAAVRRLRWALDHFNVLGVATNIPLLRAIAAEADFAAGDFSTAYLETHGAALESALQAPTLADAQPEATATLRDVLLAAALWEAERGAASTVASPAAGPFNPWTTANAARGAAHAGERRFRYRIGATDHLVTLTADADDAYAATIDGVAYPSHDAAGRVRASVNAAGAVMLAIGVRRVTAWVARRDYDLLVSLRGLHYTVAKPRPLDVEHTAHTGDVATGRQALHAPMAGTVVKVAVTQGDTVAALQTLVVLGAMKMEHAIVAPYAGRVLRVPHQAGDVVTGGTVLVELEGGAT